jgi:DNA-binding transcriptional LysR family regulator
MTRLQIKYFLTAARCLNFTEAARQLYITQPALSQQITAMEKELNMQLFVRSKGKLYLTPAAVVLLHDLPRYEKLYVDIVERAKIANAGNKGVINIGFMEGQRLPEQVLKRFFDFRKEYPNIAVEISCQSFGDLKRMLAEDEVDLVYTTDFELEKNPSYVYENVADDHAVVIVSKYHPLAQQKVTSLEQLRGETIIFLREQESPILNEMIKQDFQKVGINPNVKYVSSLDENILCVELGLGVGITNQDSYGCNNQNIVQLKDIKMAARKFVLGWKRDNTNPSIALFVNYILNQDNVK